MLSEAFGFLLQHLKMPQATFNVIDHKKRYIISKHNSRVVGAIQPSVQSGVKKILVVHME